MNVTDLLLLSYWVKIFICRLLKSNLLYCVQMHWGKNSKICIHYTWTSFFFKITEFVIIWCHYTCLWEFISIWIQLEINTFLSTIFSKTIFSNDLKSCVKNGQTNNILWITVFNCFNFWKANFPPAPVQFSWRAKSLVNSSRRILCTASRSVFPPFAAKKVTCKKGI